MYPNQPPQAPTPSPLPEAPQAPSQLPADYLNQIAPQAPKKTMFRFGIKQIIIAGAALIVVIIILSVIVNSIAASKRDPIEHLAARLNATQTIVTAAQANLKSSELRTLNSNLSLYMTNTNRDMSTPLLSAGVSVSKLSGTIVTDESTAKMAARLDDARLNAVYDAHYATEMTYQLATILNLMSQIYNSTSNVQLKTFLKSAYDNLKPTEQSFTNFTPTDN